MSVCQNSRSKIIQISQSICISMSHSSHSSLLIDSDPASLDTPDQAQADKTLCDEEQAGFMRGGNA